MTEENGQHPCDRCGWSGPRHEREVNFSHAENQWLCRVCYFRAS